MGSRRCEWLLAFIKQSTGEGSLANHNKTTVLATYSLCAPWFSPSVLTEYLTRFRVWKGMLLSVDFLLVRGMDLWKLEIYVILSGCICCKRVWILCTKFGSEHLDWTAVIFQSYLIRDKSNPHIPNQQSPYNVRQLKKTHGFKTCFPKSYGFALSVQVKGLNQD